MRIGYVRTSTKKQHTDRQINELKNYCDDIYIEKAVSARKKKRPVLNKVLADLTADDELVVIAYDRAFRNVIEGLKVLDSLTDEGVRLTSLTQSLDTSTPDGRLFYTIILAMAEWEVATLGFRTIQGLKAAVKRGATLGRPKK